MLFKIVVEGAKGEQRCILVQARTIDSAKAKMDSILADSPKIIQATPLESESDELFEVSCHQTRVFADCKDIASFLYSQPFIGVHYKHYSTSQRPAEDTVVFEYSYKHTNVKARTHTFSMNQLQIKGKYNDLFG